MKTIIAIVSLAFLSGCVGYPVSSGHMPQMDHEDFLYKSQRQHHDFMQEHHRMHQQSCRAVGMTC